MPAKKKTTPGTHSSRGKSKKQPVRREIGSLIFLFLTVLMLVGYFKQDAVFIRWLSVLFKGFFGWAYKIMAIVFLLCAGILLFHRGRKTITPALTCALLIPVDVGGLYELFDGQPADAIRWDSFRELWELGQECGSGGITGGFLSRVFERWFSAFGAGTLFILGLIALIMGSVHITPTSILHAINEAKKNKYTEKPRPERVRNSEREPYAEKRIKEPAGETARSHTKKAQVSGIDVPFDDEPAGKSRDTTAAVENVSSAGNEAPEEKAEKKGFFKKSARSITPLSVDVEPEPVKEEASVSAPTQTNEIYPRSGRDNPAAAGSASSAAAPAKPEPMISKYSEFPRVVSHDSAKRASQPASERGKLSVEEIPVETVEAEVVEAASSSSAGSAVGSGTGNDVDAIFEVFNRSVGTAQTVATARKTAAAATVFAVHDAQEAERNDETITEAEIVQPSAEPLPEIRTSLKLSGEKRSVSSTPAAPAAKEEIAAEKEIAPETASKQDAETQAYVYPDISMLDQPKETNAVDGLEEAQEGMQRLKLALESYGIKNSPIQRAVRGPSVTCYEVKLEPGVRLGQVTALCNDFAMALGVEGVRVAAIPGKAGYIGLEVPNQSVDSVGLRELIDSDEFRSSKSKTAFAIGKNINGQKIIGDVAKLPHLLVAGTTGSGKSVFLNSLILSILYRATPDEVQFILIDPKRVEFGVYNGVPHMRVPVITESKKAQGALEWAVFEMMRRYSTFSEAGARDIDTYNGMIDDPEPGEEIVGEKLPKLIIVIDELADLMMIAGKQVEDSVCRIAQMGRAAGIHLVIATQSPRADIVTGLMKANIPSRVALKVASALESRIILDAGGNAEQLVGHGDLLYVPIGTSKPTRIQGTWVSDRERKRVTDAVKKENAAKEYDASLIHAMDEAVRDKNVPEQKEESDKEEPFDEYDSLLPDAVDIILECGQASVSMLQRRLKLGYSRAARIVDQMEEIGAVGPFEGSKPRKILISKEQWQQRQVLLGSKPRGNRIVPIEEDSPLPDDFDQCQ